MVTKKKDWAISILYNVRSELSNMEEIVYESGEMSLGERIDMKALKRLINDFSRAIKILEEREQMSERREEEIRIVARYILDSSEYMFDKAMEEAEGLSDKEFEDVLKEAKKMGYESG